MRDVFFLLILSVFSLAGILWSDLFTGFKGLIVPLLVVIMLSMGVTLTPEDFLRILKRPVTVLYGALLQFTVMPLSGFLVALILGVGPDLTAGFVLVGSAPGGTASNLITYLSGGDLPYSISMTALSTLISPLITPLWTLILVGKIVPVPFMAMAVTTLKIVVLPVLVGMGVRKIAGERVKKVEAVLPYVSVMAISFIIAVIFALNVDRLKSLSLPVLIGVLVHNSLGFALGFLFGRLAGLDTKLAKTLSIEVGMQNSGLSTVLALKYFSPVAALPSAIFSLSQNLMGVALSSLFRRIR
ncbi:MAG: bile acid:sodium symporter family protein [Aquificota bacterium]|nr:bile acid:sodium symporter family protein [Aquificota bacterium]